ncbi:MAG: TerC family protein [Gammaproteobacteria bacterium]
MEWATFSQVIITLLILTLLEIVLGMDNLVFISITSNRLPQHRQKAARRFGLLLALVARLLLLASVVWLMGLKEPWFSLFAHPFSGRDLILISGGLFLLVKSTLEVHAEFEDHQASISTGGFASFTLVVIQIGVLDIIFSLDSVFTAVGLTKVYWIMATAIVIAIIAMIVASEPLSRLINQYPTIKMLALSFLLLIGTMLIADGFHYEIPRGYIYFAVAFSFFVEVLNNLVRQRKKKRSKEMRSF